MRHLSERDLDYLASILDHCDRIEETIKRFGESFEEYMADADYRDSIMMNVFQIGEASNQLTDECKEALNEIPWHEIYGTRNVIAHGYIKVNDAIIWNTVANDIPKLMEYIISHVPELE